MATSMNDDQIQAQIEKLEAEERRLRSDESEAAQHAGSDRITADAERLETIRVELDVLWDYLRQRRALRVAGRDPGEAQPRDARTVERYLG